jgi:hypothetical protein
MQIMRRQWLAQQSKLEAARMQVAAVSNEGPEEVAPVAADGEKDFDKVDEGLEVEVAVVEVAPVAADGEKDFDKVDEGLEDVAKYCNMKKRNGDPCQFNISEKPCPVHKASDVAEQPIQKPEEFCLKLRSNGAKCKWVVSIRACPKHPSAADDAAKEAARLLLPECQEITRSNKICLVRGCCFHAPMHLRCQSMKESNHTLRCYGFKKDGSEFCSLHQEFPNMSVHMAEMLWTPGMRGSDITEEMFRDKYYPGNTTPFGFEWKAYIQSIRDHVHC